MSKIDGVNRKARLILINLFLATKVLSFAYQRFANVLAQTRALSERTKVPRAKLTVPFSRGGWFLATSTDLDFVCRAAGRVYEPSPARQKR